MQIVAKSLEIRESIFHLKSLILYVISHILEISVCKIKLRVSGFIFQYRRKGVTKVSKIRFRQSRMTP